MESVRKKRLGVTTHGRQPKRLYSIWFNMKARCYYRGRDNYKDYGGRGIRVCDSWHEFIPFRDWAIASGYADDLEIDRKDVNGNYEPGNCQWITHNANQKNTRRTRLVAAFGESKTIGDWANDERSVVKAVTIRTRMFRGWDAERAITTPA